MLNFGFCSRRGSGVPLDALTYFSDPVTYDGEIVTTTGVDITPPLDALTYNGNTVKHVGGVFVTTPGVDTTPPENVYTYGGDPVTYSHQSNNYWVIAQNV